MEAIVFSFGLILCPHLHITLILNPKPLNDGVGVRGKIISNITFRQGRVSPLSSQPATPVNHVET